MDLETKEGEERSTEGSIIIFYKRRAFSMCIYSICLDVYNDAQLASEAIDYRLQCIHRPQLFQG